MNQLGRALELTQGYINAGTVYRKTQEFAELGRKQAEENGLSDLATEAHHMVVTNGFNAANADLLAKKFTRSTRDKIEETLCYGEEDIKKLFVYYIRNTNSLEDIQWAISLLASGRVSQKSIPSEEQPLYIKYFSTEVLPKFNNSVNIPADNDLHLAEKFTPDPDELNDLSSQETLSSEEYTGFQIPKNKSRRKKENPDNLDDFYRVIKMCTEGLGDYTLFNFHSISPFMSGSLLELVTQNHLGGIRNFVVASDEHKIRAYNIPSFELLKFKGTPSLEYDGAFWDASRNKFFWYDVKSVNYSNKDLDFEDILAGLKKHRDIAHWYGVEFVFFSKHSVPEKFSRILENEEIEFLSLSKIRP